MKFAFALAVLFAFCAFPLRAADTEPPAIATVSPAVGSTVSNLTQITVTFTEPVVNVQATDLIVNEQPAVSRSGSSTTYTFVISQPPPGFVAVEFDPDTSIADLAGNAFVPSGASWSYTLRDGVAPIVSVIAPAASALLSELSAIEITFSEPVSGVQASDLLIRGAAATNLQVLAANRYVFEFPAIDSGAVSVSWAGSHGISDLATPPNAFVPAGWSYSVDPVSAFADITINEVLTENLTSLADEDGQKHDWIELHNRGLNSINLVGWSLTDDPADPGKWTFPSLVLAPGKFLVVFASEKDRKTNAPPRLNHTNFRLNPLGGYLGLYSPSVPRLAVEELNYPEQRANISYGLTSGDTPSYFSTLTPGTNNATASAVAGFCQPPDASAESGFFSDPFCLVLSTPTAGAEIFYTLDGSTPTLASLPYVDALNIAGTPAKGVVMVRATAFREGLLPSTITTRTFIYPDHVLTQPTNPAGFPLVWDSPCTIAGINCSDAVADYEMDPQVLTNTASNYRNLARQGLLSIPTISIVTDSNLLFGSAQGVYVRREPFNQQQINVEMINPDGSSGFNVPAGLEIVGGTSPNDQGTLWKSRKLSMRLMFRGEFGTTKLRHKIFPDTTVDAFDTVVLDAGLNYVWSYNGGSAPDDQRQRAQYVRDQFMSDLQNAMGRVGPHGRPVHVYLNGLYWGLHGLHERPDHSFSAEHFGGDKADYDVIKHRVGTVVNGSSASYTAMFNFARTGLAGNANYETLQQQHLDLPWFIDYMIMNFWGGNDDWAHQNWYASRRRVPAGLWRYISWDAEHVLKSVTYDSTVKNDANGPTELFQLLRGNSEFRLKFADHVHKHFFNGGVFHTETTNIVTDANLSQNQPASLYMNRIREIETAIVAESARWGDTGETGAPRANSPLTRDVHWTNELNGLMGRTNLAGYSSSYFPRRTAIVLNQLRALGVYPSNLPPVFSQHGGRVAPGFAVYMTNMTPDSAIYFTTNGVDPRVYGSGAISAHARLYTGDPLVLGETTILKARALISTNWTALNEAVFTIAEPGVSVAVTEIMYNPVGGDAFEYFEVQNIGSTPLDLSGYYFEGVVYTFPAGSIFAPGARVLLASDSNPSAFASRYPGVSVYGYYDTQLANGGERLSLHAPGGALVLSVDYDDANGWPTQPDGQGPSLELIDAHGNPDDPANWRPSSAVDGTPGTENSSPPPSVVLLNEVHASQGPSDWLELRNISASSASLDGWSLTDDGAPRKFVFPNGTSIPANGYLLVHCDTNSSPPGVHTGFSLPGELGSVFLYNAATSRVDAISFGKQVAGYSIGRTAATWGLMSPSPGGPNSSPAALAPQSAIAINEWLADPPAAGSDWIELYNGSMLPVSCSIFLGDGATVHRLPPLSFLPPGGFIQLLADEAPGTNHLDFRLGGSGGSIVAYDAAGLEFERVNYGLQVETVSQGRLPDGVGNIIAFPGTASPGASNYVSTYNGPYLNEVLARNQVLQSPWGSYADWIEIHNPTASPFNLSGTSLTDSLGNPFQWTFPLGTTIPANGYLVVWCDAARAPSVTGPNLNTGFNLSGDSGAVYLVSNTGQALDAIEYGPQIFDLSIGRSTGQWRLLSTPTPGAINASSTALGSAIGLRINEWMADPGEGDDWFEIYNPGAQPVDLNGLFVTDDLSIAGQDAFRIGALSFVGAKGFALFEADGNPGNGRHHVNFNLNAGGEALRLYSASFALIDTVYFGRQSRGVSEGRLPDGQAALVKFHGSPTPGVSNYRRLGDVAISEVLSHSDAPLEDGIELSNLSTGSVNIAGWYLSDSIANPRKFRIPAGTTMTGGQFMVFYEAQLNGGAGSLVPFTLDSIRGDSVYLSQADGADNLTGYRSQVSFGAAPNGVSFGRFVSSVAEEFVAQSERTLEAANVYPLVGPVVVNEIMYHPLTPAGADDEDEYIELYNTTTSSVALYDPAHATNRWRVRGGIEFDFPAVTLPPRSYGLLVNFDPADSSALTSFRERFGIPATVPIYGPYQGKLDNAGERVELFKPLPPQSSGSDAGYVPYVLVEAINYDDRAPWPTEADGAGPSLQRGRPAQFANEPLNWKAAAATPGRANVTGSGYVDFDQDGMSDDWEAEYEFDSAQPADAQADADGDGNSNYQEFLDGTDPRSAQSALFAPIITAQPQDATVPRGSNATFTVTASGLGIKYRWRVNGVELPGQTNASLFLDPVQNSDAGDYSVLVFNAAGLDVSRSARLVVTQPPRIIQQPQSARVSTNGTANFFVSVVGTGAIQYQWQFNGTNIPGANSSSLALPNLQLEQSGDYRVLVTDDIATVASDTATLTVLERPSIVSAPIGATVAVGSSATFTAVGRGTLPITFRWRRINVFLTNAMYVVHGNTNSFTVENVQTNDAVNYSVNLLNTAGVSPLSSQAYLVVVIPPTNQTAAAGQDVTFHTVAVGRPSIQYQWQFQGNPLLHETNASLTVSNVQPSHAGTYTVTVSPITNTVVLPGIFSASLSVVGGPPVLVEPGTQPDGTFAFLVDTAEAGTYVVEASTNLIDWINLGTVAVAAQQTPYTDTGATNNTRRFYRIRPE